MRENSIPAMLRERATLRPDETAFTFVDYEQDWAGVAESLTWSQLYRRTRSVARELTARGSTGDRAVILAPQGLEYVLAFLGALQAGQIAVPLSMPLGGASDERVSAVLGDASPSTILTTSSVAGDIAECIGSEARERGTPSLIEVDLLDLDSPGGPTDEASNTPDIAYLQYTSGSTRTPAGVEISHKNIHVNVEQILSSLYRDRGDAAPPDTTVVSWLPFFHDMGLVLGIAIPILGGFHGVLTSPGSFLQRPARWMQLTASHSSVFTGGPNIAFELTAAKTSDDDMAGLDLGDVRNIVSGAERVQPATLRRFAKRFASYNLDPKVLRPSYGLAEATVFVATRESDQPPLTGHFESEELTAGHAKRCPRGDGTPLVSYGMPRSPTVRIVDPETGIECPHGTVGEIWAHGDNVATGYWQKPQETERTFGATIVGPSAGTPEGPWLRTGDLGVVSEGELFIIGRIKDLLIVYGRNHSPDDIEAAIQEITGGRCVAIAVPDDDGVEKLVTIVEFKARGDSDEAMRALGLVRREITSKISKSQGLSVADLVLVPPHSIPLTTSGKVRRRDCLQRYLRDEFTRLDGSQREKRVKPDATDTASAGADVTLTQRLHTLRQQQHDLLFGMVCEQAATVLGYPGPDDIDPECTFQDLGFDSVKATELLDRLKTVTGLPLPPTLAFDYPTPAELATHLGQLLSGTVAAAPPVQPQVRTDEPVAVVGMACRFPGGVDSAAALWDLVAGGAEAVGQFPTDRGWDLADLFDPDPDAVGKTYTRAGAFLTDVSGFDAEFFGISAREALTMDPQQRLLLEVCWEALETTRIDPAALVGSETGVFVGAWSQQYGGGGSDGAEGYAMTGTSTSVASGRVAYALGLQGPAITVDTACSSSLVAAHLAAQSLRNGECGLALAGGVTVMTTPAVFTEFSRQRGLAADGRCKAFAAAADGTGWGEGAAVLVLERLSDAHRNNHPVLAVIAGSAINQDGASNGLTAPNGPAQQRVISQAVANAGIGLDEVDVVEAHGTGTTLGDPIEAGALIATYGAARGPEHPLWLGSIKSNIGHTQAAAGVAGMIKMIAALNHDSLPPTRNVDRPSPHIDWSAGTVRLLTEPVPWPVRDHPRTAAVSSFGISGTNAHLILQQAPTPPPDATEPTDHDGALGLPVLPLWTVSARSRAALCAQADRLHQFLIRRPDLDLSDVAYSLAGTRTHHPHRAVVTVPVGSPDPRAELLAALEALAADQPHPQLIQHHQRATSAGNTVLVFPGQGGQYPGMAAELYGRHHAFSAALDECDQALVARTGWSVRAVIRGEPGAPSLDRVDVVQPVLFAVMVSLARTLISYGIEPDAVIGHSQGEIAAAHVAGVFTLEQAAKIVALRSSALADLAGAGAMASVLLAADEVAARLRPYGDALAVVAVNGPTQTIISGGPAAMQRFVAACEADNVQIRSIPVDYASHCSQVEPLRERLLEELAGLTPKPGRIALYSTVDGVMSDQPLDTTTMTADYWYANLRQPVRFYDSIRHLLASAEQVFVEVSPHPVLAPAIADTLAGAAGRPGSAVIPTLHRERADLDALTTTLARLQVHGRSPDWSVVYPHARTVELPTYPFQHHRYWLTPQPSGDAAGLGLDQPQHPLLGAITTLADRDEVVATGRLALGSQRWLAAHRVGDVVVLPGTGFVDVVLGVGDYVGCPVIDELVLHTPLVLAEHTPTDIQISVADPDGGGRRSFNVHSRVGADHRAEPGWVLHASGILRTVQTAAGEPPAALPMTTIDVEGFYRELAACGLHYEPPFCSVRGIGHDPADPDHIYAEVALPAGTDVTGYGIHPALLDAALQPIAAALGVETDAEAVVRLPFVFTGVTLYATAATRLQVWLTRTGTDTFTLQASDPAGAPVISIDTVVVRVLPDTATLTPATTAAPSVQGLWELAWPPLSAGTAAAAELPQWTVVAEDLDALPTGLRRGSVRPELDAVKPCPPVVIWSVAVPDLRGDNGDAVSGIHVLTRRVLAGLQAWLARPDTSGTVLVVLTCRAVTTSPYDRAPDLAQAAVWALIHSAQNEYPGRIRLVDIDDAATSTDILRQMLATFTGTGGEPQLALRDGIAHMPRLTPARALTPPPTPHWQLITTGRGDLANLTLVPTPAPTALGPGQIRVQIRAAGLNFHDVVVALAAISDEGLGAEAAGVVIDTADDVTDFAPGDAVMGLFPNNAFAPTATTDHRGVVAVPPGWSYPQAASVPAAYITAYSVLIDIAQLSAGQRVLIHSAAGGVGQAAIRLAQHVGAEVFATAHPAKHHILRGLGIPEDHIASSRTLDFGDTFAAAGGGRGMDVVLNSLRDEFVDASLRLVVPGGCFVEIGKTDIRAAADVAHTHPDLSYHAYDLSAATPEQLQHAWAGVRELIEYAVIQPLPVTSYGLLRAPQAFRDMSQARHTGKIVLTPPAVLDPKGTVLITGGTGMLGGLFAEHLITGYGVRRLLLTSRRGSSTPEAVELARRLESLGAHVTISACDCANPTKLAALIDSIPAEHPLTAVIHAAGILDDAVTSQLTAQQLDNVLAAKADSAWYLHQLTANIELAAFVLFSSAAGVLGAPGQANYAAANAVLDALAHNHRAAISLAWGYWQPASGMTGNLESRDLTRLARSGTVAITTNQGLALFDAALAQQHPNLIPAPLSTRALAALARENSLPPILSALITTRPQAAAVDSRGLRARLAGLTPDRQQAILADLVITATAAVLAHPDPAAMDLDQPFKDLGIDSLSALELRNTLSAQTGVTLPATVTFDHPTPTMLAAHLAELLNVTAAPAAAPAVVATEGAEPVDNRLAYLDQAAFLGLRAGHVSLLQVTWIYDRPVDVDGLRRFHRNLGRGLLGRRIERSPVPFARDHWVLAPPPEEIDFAATLRRRADVGAWVDERARLPIDPEWGPAWHLGVLPLEDGGTAISLVASHAVVDAIAFGQAIVDAVEGRTLDLGYLPAGSRTLRRALRADLRQTAKELPEVMHALGGVTRRLRRDREEFRSSIKAAPPSPKSAGGDQTVAVPAVTACIDLAEWDACAKRLGASSNSLVGGVACRLAVRAGRVQDDGTVTLRLVVSLRTEGDTRGNALTAVDVAVDPEHAATDLGGMHAKITRAVLEAMEDSDNEFLAPLPLAAMTPAWVARRLVGMAAGGPSLPVTCSNVGDLPPAANRPDGTDADSAYMRQLEPDITRNELEGTGGRMLLSSGRSRGQMRIGVSAYIVGRSNTTDELRELVSRTLAEFDLNAEIDC
ncbi:type I polyketide synthase [Mycobacterium persicum]|uniref:type I polyketide synthase n=1 Tax=Mycobacterium persicum TaxID=1487726 RepID=UPI0009F3263D|nr:type I polyketide synthase [Mycobacterium persicum]ORB52070.1 fatty acyl-AMP ligase [Mycobacterium persicum]